MAIAVKELREISVDPNTLVKLGCSFEHCSSPITISENGNGHRKEALGETVVIFETGKPDGNRNGHQDNLNLPIGYLSEVAFTRKEREFEKNHSSNGGVDPWSSPAGKHRLLKLE